MYFDCLTIINAGGVDLDRFCVRNFLVSYFSNGSLLCLGFSVVDVFCTEDCAEAFVWGDRRVLNFKTRAEPSIVVT